MKRQGNSRGVIVLSEGRQDNCRARIVLSTAGQRNSGREIALSTRGQGDYAPAHGIPSGLHAVPALFHAASAGGYAVSDPCHDVRSGVRAISSHVLGIPSGAHAASSRVRGAYSGCHGVSIHKSAKETSHNGVPDRNQGATQRDLTTNEDPISACAGNQEVGRGVSPRRGKAHSRSVIFGAVRHRALPAPALRVADFLRPPAISSFASGYGSLGLLAGGGAPKEGVLIVDSGAEPAVMDAARRGQRHWLSRPALQSRRGW